MEARKVNIANGWLWIKQGYWLFKKSPVLWVVLAAIGVIGLIGISTIPVIGDPLATLLFPVLLAGYMLGCHALEHDEELELSHLLAGFRNNTTQLVTLGGISLISQMLILGVMMLTGGAVLVSILMSGKPVDNPEILLIRHELFMKPRKRLLDRRNNGARVRGFAQAWSCDQSRQL